MLFIKSTVATAHGVILAKEAELSSTQGEKNISEMLNSRRNGSNIANHAWANDHRIDFDSRKIVFRKKNDVFLIQNFLALQNFFKLAKMLLNSMLQCLMQ